MIRTLYRRVRDVRAGGAIDPEGDWFRTDHSLTRERWVGTGEGNAGEEVILRPVGVTGREWLVSMSTLDGGEEPLAGPLDYDAAVERAEQLMTNAAQGQIVVADEAAAV